MTAVASFYFASRATTDVAAGGIGPPPTLTSVEPHIFPSGGPSEVKLKITGSNLNAVTSAQLVSGTNQLSDPAAVSNATQAQATFAVPADAFKGKWTVVVTDSAGRQARLADAVEITGAAPGGSGPPPDPQHVTPPTLSSGGSDPVTLTITGNNLNTITSAQLVSGVAGATPLTDPAVVSNANRVEARFTIPAEAPKRKWTVVVMDSAGREARLPDAVEINGAAPGGSGPAPTLTSVDPGTLPSGGPGAIPLTITGNNLNAVTSAQLISEAPGATPLTDTAVVSNANRVEAKFAIPPDAFKGKWTVVVKDSAGREARLPDAVEIT